MAGEDEKRKILIDLLDATFAKDYDRIGAMLTEDFAIWMAPSARKHGIPIPLEGRANFLNFNRKVQDIPGMWKPHSYEVKRIYFDGDHAALWVRFLGEFEGGAPYDNEYVFTFRFVGDKIAEKREFVDTAYIDHQRDAARKKAAAQAG
jgi:ketosteroid isomerase-like protein